MKFYKVVIPKNYAVGWEGYNRVISAEKSTVFLLAAKSVEEAEDALHQFVGEFGAAETGSDFALKFEMKEVKEMPDFALAWQRLSGDLGSIEIQSIAIKQVDSFCVSGRISLKEENKVRTMYVTPGGDDKDFDFQQLWTDKTILRDIYNLF